MRRSDPRRSARPAADPNYIQHSAHTAPGRERLFDLIKGLPAELRHGPDLSMAEGDMLTGLGSSTTMRARFRIALRT
ncbi:hypothetical protein OG762_48755 (plasmid) [Streptomyces sp. NBC_01136]|uniref:hypothetical protein n=1 Tax=unclassified Streptomyces TaxID=2593676 RepID=UPI002F909A32|nr:hypothetical protein OG762_48755 [Streptomyces sp. NBC_01136]